MLTLLLSAVTAAILYSLARRDPEFRRATSPDSVGFFSALAAIASALGSAAGGAGTTAAAAAPAVAGAAGTAAGALGSAAGSIGSGLGSAAGALGSALSSVPSTLGSAGSAIGGALSEIPSFGAQVGSTLEGAGNAVVNALPSFGGGGEAGILEGLGQTVPQGVELVGPDAAINAGLGPGNLSEQALMLPRTMPQSMGGIAQGAPLPASFGGPTGTTQVADTGALRQAMGMLNQGSGGARERDNALADAFSPMSMLEGILDPFSSYFQQPPTPQMDFGFGERRPIQQANFNMQDRLGSLVRAFQLQG